MNCLNVINHENVYANRCYIAGAASLDVRGTPKMAAKTVVHFELSNEKLSQQ